MSGSGKTQFAKALARSYRKTGRGVLVLHKPLEPWPADCVSWQTPNPDAFLRMFEQARGCTCFCEMSDAGASKYAEAWRDTGTAGRHLGHFVFYMCQRAPQVHPDIRESCERLFLFRCKPNTAEDWVKEEGDKSLWQATELPLFWYFDRPRLGPAVKCPPIPL